MWLHIFLISFFWLLSNCRILMQLFQLFIEWIVDSLYNISHKIKIHIWSYLIVLLKPTRFNVFNLIICKISKLSTTNRKLTDPKMRITEKIFKHATIFFSLLNTKSDIAVCFIQYSQACIFHSTSNRSFFSSKP